VVEYNVTSLVAGNGTVSFALVSASPSATEFASREQALASMRPQLIVGY
jgi:hypothetical protein